MGCVARRPVVPAAGGGRRAAALQWPRGHPFHLAARRRRRRCRHGPPAPPAARRRTRRRGRGRQRRQPDAAAGAGERRGRQRRRHGRGREDRVRRLPTFGRDRRVAAATVHGRRRPAGCSGAGDGAVVPVGRAFDRSRHASGGRVGPRARRVSGAARRRPRVPAPRPLRPGRRTQGLRAAAPPDRRDRCDRPEVRVRAAEAARALACRSAGRRRGRDRRQACGARAG